jgi:uncharacterized protein (TIGR03437 family)
LAEQVTILIGNVPARVEWAGRVAAGLDQFNVWIPDSLPDGDARVVAESGGLRTQDGALITIRR